MVCQLATPWQGAEDPPPALPSKQRGNTKNEGVCMKKSVVRVSRIGLLLGALAVPAFATFPLPMPHPPVSVSIPMSTASASKPAPANPGGGLQVLR
jgi:hypothetical protein